MTAVSIDEEPELLHSSEELEHTIRELEEEIVQEELQAKQQGNLTNEALPSGEPRYFESVSDKGKIDMVQVDLLKKLQSSSDTLFRQTQHTLYNYLRWWEQVTDRAYLQDCNTRVSLNSNSQTYQEKPIEAHMVSGAVSEISKKNLYHAFASEAEVDFLNNFQTNFFYLRPKTGLGFSTGFFLKDEKGRIWKAKVGWESYREPLASRLAWGMGFFVDEVHHVRNMRMSFSPDSGTLSELETLFDKKQRKLEESLMGLILQDGTVIDLIDTPSYSPDVTSLYQEHRAEIATLIFKAMVLERRDPNIVRVGQWSFDALKGYELRAVRMLGMLSFWLGNPDIKFDNNRIFLKCRGSHYDGTDNFKSCVESGNYAYEFTIHDLGLAFAAHPNEFDDLAHKLDLVKGNDGVVSIKIDTRGRDVYAWQKINLEDASTFVDRLAQLTEEQIKQALVASGYPYPAVLQLTEKLKKRRNEMVENITPGRYDLLPVDESISSNTSGNLVINGKLVTIPHDDFVLVNGSLTNDISRNQHGRHSEMLRD